MGGTDHPTAVTVITRTRADTYEVTDATALQPLFEDDLYMQDIFNRALSASLLAADPLVTSLRGRPDLLRTAARRDG
jgi:hypothetical protein